MHHDFETVDADMDVLERLLERGHDFRLALFGGIEPLAQGEDALLGRRRPVAALA